MQAEKLVCIGIDDSGVEAVFNTDKFVQKTEINARPNEHGSYDPEQVRLGLMTKLGIG
ncbi:hypothetical protein [Pseudochelatococcus contaminans]|uniref:Uncharacterized protein n=1 Tax=Pseudochelatococcus contaminans TaxID=1538103 RepID=A0A7W5Z889_9HYPH|nr:hypothetical protein [Pseudochelatococcus contaminans]MBB3811449.1 hypothetical protein [Pseudochelatococcus contaminans]